MRGRLAWLLLFAAAATSVVTRAGPGRAEPAVGSRPFLLQGPDGGSVALLPALSGDCRRAAIAHRDQIFVVDRATGDEVLASVSPEGAPGDGASTFPTLSDDVRLVAFASYAGNLVGEPRQARYQGFLRDLARGATLRVGGFGGLGFLSGDGSTLVYLSAPSLPRGPHAPRRVLAHDVASGRTRAVAVPGGALPNAESLHPALSHSGRFLAFASGASNLVPGAEWRGFDVFVLDRETDGLERVSRVEGGGPPDGDSDVPSLDATGRWVAFASDAANLVARDHAGVRDVFVFDRATGSTERVSMAPGGREADGPSDWPAISRDGRFVAFVSRATNLVPGDANGFADVFLADRRGGAVVRLSVPEGGGEADEESGTTGLVWSADGSCLAFQSWAGNLVADDPRGEDVFVVELRPPSWR